MTERIFYTDSETLEFSSAVVSVDETRTRVELARTAFYPDSGGQPHDLGTLNGIAVVDVQEEDDRIIHVLAAPFEGSEAHGMVDSARRRDHMEQHSGQHLLSAVFETLLKAKTVSFHLGAESSTIDLEVAALMPAQIRAVEERANALVREDRPLGISFEDAAEARGLRKESSREGTLRIVSINGVDRSACGGTHVASTGRIGPILIRKIEKIRSTQRVEFVCGARATERARADYEALSAIARRLTSTLDGAPALVETLQEQGKEAEKARRKLALELAGFRGRALYESAPAGGARRSHVERLALAPDEETRALAQGYCAAGPDGIFIAACAAPPTVLVAVAAATGLHAGNLLKAALARHGGRGGGAASSAQASLPDAAALEALVAELAQA
jgi:alanyl-tRNA synthetase